MIYGNKILEKLRQFFKGLNDGIQTKQTYASTEAFAGVACARLGARLIIRDK